MVLCYFDVYRTAIFLIGFCGENKDTKTQKKKLNPKMGFSFFPMI